MSTVLRFQPPIATDDNSSASSLVLWVTNLQ